MTEDKRFTVTQDFEEHHRQIRDNGHIIMGCFIETQAEVIVNLLNELHDEKEKWKSFCLNSSSENSILWNEIDLMQEQGAEPSDAFKEYRYKLKKELFE